MYSKFVFVINIFFFRIVRIVYVCYWRIFVFKIPDELLSYLRSPEWDEWVCLRVIGGEVLNILNRSLLSLERRRLVNLHSQYALANNRVKVTAAQGRGVQTADEQKAGDIVAPQVIEEIKVKVKDVKKKKKKQETETDNENVSFCNVIGIAISQKKKELCYLAGSHELYVNCS